MPGGWHASGTRRLGAERKARFDPWSSGGNTMRVKYLAAGLVAWAAFVLAGEARAGDVIRLSMPGDVDAPTLDLKGRPADLDAEVYNTYWRGGWGWRGGGGWRGGWGGGWGWRA